MKVDLANKKDKKIEIKDSIWKEDFNQDLIAHAIYVYQSNQRKGSAKVKNRGEVSGGGKKPWKQKGTGRARHGSIRSPIWVGGGVSHGPTGEQNWKKKLNKKMRRKAVRSLLSEMYRNKNVDFIIISGTRADNKPKAIREKNLNMFDEKKKSLLITENKDEKLAFRNVPYINVIDPSNINIYVVGNAHKVYINEEILDKLESILE